MVEKSNKVVIRLLNKLSLLIKSQGSQNSRLEVCRLGATFYNENSLVYNRLSGEVQNAIDMIMVLEQQDGFKEPRILHIDLDEVKKLIDLFQQNIGRNRSTANIA